MDTNPSQPPVPIPVYTRMHKEDQQATESFIVHSESASGNNASADSMAEADPGLSAPSIDPYVLADKTISVSEGLKTVLTSPITGKGASSIARQIEEEEASNIIKLEALAKLVSNVQPSFKDLDSSKDDLVINVDDSDKDEELEKDEVHHTPNDETENSLVPKSSSPRSSQIQELTNQVLILESQKNKLKLKKNKAEAEAALLKAQLSFPNVEQLNELLDLPSKLNDMTEEVKRLKTHVHNLEIELLGDLKEIPPKLEDFTKTIISLTSQVVELKTLQWGHPIEFISLPNQVKLVQEAKNLGCSSKSLAESGDQGVPSADQADSMPAEGEKNTNQATIS
ncbi:hypothetical protein Tco_0639173 [Tanacetum coccineum]